MSWNGPTMTDSGGFQVFSLGHGRGRKNGEKDYMPGDAPPDIDGDPREPRRFTITDEKVVFQSPRDGQTLELSPEISVQIQEDIGADIYFAFDECTDPVWPYEYQKEAVEPFDGFGIGGRVDLSEKENIATVFHWTLAHLPKEKPVHALGLGSPKETIEAIAEGVDLFDCVSPTREARNGTIYTSRGRLHIENAPYREDFSPLEDGCGCYTCAHFTKSYLHHLFRAKELLAKRLATIHNLTFINNLVRQAREAIRAGAFPDFQRGFYEKKIY